MKKFIILWLVLFMGAMCVNAQEAYAYYDSSDNSLNFCYDNSRSSWVSKGKSTYSLNTGSNAPEWHSIATRVTNVWFYSAFANYRPTSCYEWFDGMYNLTTFHYLNRLNTSNVTEMTYMFWNCSKLTSLDLSTFNTSNVTKMNSMFAHCESLTGINVSSFNTSKVTEMFGMFQECHSLISVDLTSFNTSKVTDMGNMFKNCYKLTSLDISSFKITKENSYHLLYNCSALKTLIIPSTAGLLDSEACYGVGTTSSPCTLVFPEGFEIEKTSMGSGWYKWKSGYFWDTQKQAYAYYDPNDNSLNFCYDTERNDWEIQGKKTWSLNQGNNLPGWNSIASSVTNVYFYTDFADYRPTSCHGWFCDMTNLTTFYHLYRLNMQYVTDMSYMFARCGKLGSLDLSSFNTSKVTNMRCMFNSCFSLTSLDVSSFNTSNVTDMGSMFYSCESLTSLNLSNFNTSKVTNMGSMFAECSNLKSLDLTSFNTSNVTDMLFMFDQCSKLSSVDVSSFDTSKVEEMHGMFEDCSSLSKLDISNFTLKSTTSTLYLLLRCSNLDVLKIPSTAGYLYDNACSDVGTKDIPCTLVYPSGFTPEKTSTGTGWYIWKGGYFKDTPAEAYAWLSSDGKKLTFCNDSQKSSRAGTTYALNTGTNNPGWYDKRAGITSVVFNSAFASARPTTCYRWFYGMASLTGITGMQYLNTEEVTSMASMFNGCSSLTSLNLSKFDTGSVTSMNYMFYKCSKLTSLDLGSFDTSSTKTMKYMFANCSKMENVVLYSSAEIPSSFGGPEIPVCETEFVTYNVTDLTSMFENCSSLNSFLFPGLTLEPTTTTTNMYKGCTAMQVVYVTSETINNLDATAFKGVGTTTSCRLEIEDDFTPNISSRVLPYEDSNGEGYVMWKGGKFEDYLDAYAVYLGGELTFYYDRYLSRWHAAGVTDEGPFPYKVNITNDAPRWLSEASSTTKVEFDSTFKDYKPNTTYRWFYQMTGLTSITNIKYLNTSKVTSMASMFNGCSKLTTIDLSNFSTANVTSLNYMFYKCSKLSSLDISRFTLKSSITTTAMMQNCSALQTLTIPSTAGYINANACTGVGTKTAPCALVYPSGFTPEKTSTGTGWYIWKGGYFKDNNVKIGDANGDGEVTVNDIQIVVEYVLGNNPSGIILANAEVTGDGEVSINDVSAIAEIVLNSPATIPASARETTTDALAMTANGRHCTLHMDNSEPYHAFQFTLNVPEGGSIGNVKLAQGRANGHHVEWKELAPGTYNVVAYAQSGEALRDGTKALLSFDIAGCDPDDVSVEGIQMIDGWCKTVLLPNASGVTTGIAWATEEAGSDDSPIYNTVGIRTNTPQRGVYIKNGQKMVKK